MIYVGIDVAKDKHDCCILESEADKLYPVFTIPNNKAGFDELYEKIFTVTDDKTKIKVGLEATGHYSLNLLGSLIDKGLFLHPSRLHKQWFSSKIQLPHLLNIPYLS